MNDIRKDELIKGLSDSQVNESKSKYGTNQLAKKETESLWSMFIGAFDDIWIKVLCAALVLKIALAVLGVFVPALSGSNDVIEIISIILAIAHNVNKLHNKIQYNRTGKHWFEIKKA